MSSASNDEPSKTGRESGGRPDRPSSGDGSVPANSKAPRGLSQPAWIAGAGFDLLFFIATPLLIVPILLATNSLVSVERISLWVLACAVIGHQLPGLMRAYGDAELFRRYRGRLVAVPMALLIICFVFAWRDMQSLIVLLLLWGFWHVTMQAYRFAAIYEGKAGSPDSYTSQIDWLMCVAWFGGGLVWSPTRIEQILRACYEAGIPLLLPNTFHVFQWLWLGFTIIVTVVFTINFLNRRARGAADNPIKLLAMVTSFAFWWYCMVVAKNALLGIAMFEIFHAVQYVALVWIFNRRRSEGNPQVGRFTRTMFGRGGMMLIIYLGLILGFGFALGMLPSLFVPDQPPTIALYGVVAAFTFFHFYIDGLIWDLREKSTRTALGLAEQHGISDRITNLGSEAGHLLKWSLFIVPVVFLGTSEYRSQDRTLTLNHYRHLALTVPNSVQALDNYASALRAEAETARADGDDETASRYLEEALDMYKLILESDGSAFMAHVSRGVILRDQFKFQQARQEFDKALEINPDYAIAHNEMGKLVYLNAMEQFETALATRNRSALRRAEQSFVAARGHFEKAIDLAPREASAFQSLGDYYRQHAVLNLSGTPDPLPDVDELKLAVVQFDKALEIDPDFVMALISRGATWQRLGEIAKALADYDRAIGLQPDNLQLYFFRAKLHRSSLAYQDALDDFRRATEDPQVAPIAYFEIALTLSAPTDLRDLEEAARNAKEACELTDYRTSAFVMTLSQLHVEQGDVQGGIEVLQRALQNADDQSAPVIAQQIEQLNQLLQSPPRNE